MEKKCCLINRNSYKKCPCPSVSGFSTTKTYCVWSMVLITHTVSSPIHHIIYSMYLLSLQQTSEILAQNVFYDDLVTVMRTMWNCMCHEVLICSKETSWCSATSKNKAPCSSTWTNRPFYILYNIIIFLICLQCFYFVIKPILYFIILELLIILKIHLRNLCFQGCIFKQPL